MKEQHKVWQNKWRQIMEKPINVEKEVDCDFDLHFDIWELGKKAFFKLFEHFPKGKEIAERAYLLRWGELGSLGNKLPNEEAIIEETQKAITIINNLFPSEELDNPKITVKYGDEKLRLELLSETDPISIDVNDNLSQLIKRGNGENGYNAYFFLREPFYRMSSSYIPRNWILWTLTELPKTNPYTPLLKLEYNNCDVALTNDGILVFKLIAH